MDHLNKYLYPWAETWRRVWGTEKNRGPNFRMTYLRKKCPVQRRKFQMTDFSRSVGCMKSAYMILFLTNNLYSISEQIIPPWYLFYSVRRPYFATLSITLLLEILGGRMHGPSPNSNFRGTSPQFP